MMRTTSTLVKALAALSALLPFCTTGFASVVYDNATTDLNRTYGPNATPFGDEVTLAPGNARTITDFQFEYFLGAGSGNETAQLVLYKNDGAPVTRTLPDGTTVDVATPSTVLYTSPVLNLQSGYQIAEVAGISIDVPDTFTWAVTFNGVETGEVAGLRLYSPPTVGSSFDDFWQNNGGTWNTYVFPDGTPANFAARITAVPEPSTIALAFLTGLGYLGFLGFKRRNA